MRYNQLCFVLGGQKRSSDAASTANAS